MYSMTAFARKSAENDFGSLTVELRAVNARYLELSWRLPENLRCLENDLRIAARAKLSRGKIECNLRYSSSTKQPTQLAIDHKFLAALLQTEQQIAGLLHNQARVSALEVMRWPGVIVESEQATESLIALAKVLFADVLEDLLIMRATEGSSIADFLLSRVNQMTLIIEGITKRQPEIMQLQQRKLTERMQSIIHDCDPGRVAAEIALLAQKIDVSEELDRLLTHLSSVKKTITQGGCVGRRLDFLMQELNREVNTLGAKSVDSDVTADVIELKVLIEQMREQVQNVE